MRACARNTGEVLPERLRPLLVGSAVCLVLALPASAAGVSSLPQSADADTLVSLARQRYEARAYGEALDLLGQVFARQPLHLPAHNLFLDVHRRQGTLGDLSTHYRGLLDRRPWDASAQYLYGRWLLHNLRGREARTSARSYFEEALRLDPRNGWAALALAPLAMAERDGARALELARLAVDLLPGEAGAIRTLSALLRANDRGAEAVGLLDAMVRRYPNEPSLWLELWSMQWRTAEDRDAARAAIRAQVAATRGLFMRSPEDFKALAGFLRSSVMNDRDASYAAWAEFARLFPDHPEAPVALLRAAAGFEGADRLGAYEDILDRYPDSPLRFELRVRILTDLIRQERYDEAVLEARRLTRLDEDETVDMGGMRRIGGSFRSQWGVTLHGIGYGAWFAAAQADAGVDERAVARLRNRDPLRDYPISPAAFEAARALERSGCRDPRTLEYVATRLLGNSMDMYQELGMKLLARLEEVLRGSDADGELKTAAYGPDPGRDLDRRMLGVRADVVLHLVRSGRTREAEEAADALVASATDGSGRIDPRRGPSRDRLKVHFAVASAYEAAGRAGDAVEHALRALAMSSSRGWGHSLDELLARLLPRLATTELEVLDTGSRDAFSDAGSSGTDATGTGSSTTSASTAGASTAGASTAGASATDASATGDRMELPLNRLGLDFHGDARQIGRALAGDRLLVGFWQPGSPAGIELLDRLAALHDRFADRGLSVLAVALDDSARSTERTTRRRNLPYPTASGDLDRSRRAGLVVAPATILLDGTTVVRARQLGLGPDPEAWLAAWSEVIAAALGDASGR